MHLTNKIQTYHQSSIRQQFRLKDSNIFHMIVRNQRNLLLLIFLVTLVIISYFFFFRIDLTSDKRYSIASQTKNLMEKIDSPLEVVIYLDGDLNPGFQRLKKSTVELLDELAIYSHKSISIKYENPSLADSPSEREKRYAVEYKGIILPHYFFSDFGCLTKLFWKSSPKKE